MRMRWIVTTLLVLVFSINVVIAQTSNASVGGTVSDASGAFIPGVEVTARNVGTGIANNTISNETGTYQFPSLQPGTYQVTAQLAGFQTASYNDVVLGGAQQVRLNFTLRVGDVATQVDVTISTDTALATTSASIASVLSESRVRELPLGNRNVLDLLAGMAGTGATEGDLDGYFAGNRLSAVNITLDGMSVSTGRYDQGTLGTTYMSPDLVEEVRVTTGTVDAERGRGSGQVAMVSRSGTNDFRGSAFWTNRNSVFAASNWFNNFFNRPGDFENRNQYGVRLGGPIRKDKTFFFFLMDNQRTAIRQDFVGLVYTPEARQGTFRFFPNADNRNSVQPNATVDRNGALLRPASEMLSINLFGGLDPNRRAIDPSGWMQRVVLSRMPQPNDWSVGDGLNIAGIRFTRRIYGFDTNIQDQVDRNNRDQFTVRLDHYFNPANKLSFVMTRENSKNRADTAGFGDWPDAPQGANHKYPRLYNFSFVSTLSNNMVNEVRVGYRMHDVAQWPPYYIGRQRFQTDIESAITDEAKVAYDLLHEVDGKRFLPVLIGLGQVPMQSNSFGSHRGSSSPMLSFGDTVSWTKARHTFKSGFEMRRDSTDGWNDNNFTPHVMMGGGNVLSPIDTPLVQGLTSPNATNARNIIYNLSGSIDFVRQGFDLTSSEPPLEFKGYQHGVLEKRRHWRANEMNMFFKDDWKVSQNLTLNLGLSWEWYGVPYETRGLAGRVIGGFQRVCGYTECGPINVELVGKHSPQPDKRLFSNDWNNFSPAIGFSWSLPGLGRSTILRGGYGIAYSGRQIIQVMGTGGLDAGGGTLPGLAGITGGNGLTYTRTDNWSLSNLRLPFEPQFKPLEPISLTAPRTLTMNMYDPNRRVPYIQNFNLSIQREVASGVVVDVSYVGSKGTKLYGRMPLNAVNIYDTAFLEAFNMTRSGGNHPLFDQMLMGLNIPGVGVVNGSTITGSSALRRYTATRTFVANGAAGALANFLTTSTNVTGFGGGFIRNSGRFTEDFLLPYPQFADMGLNANVANSTYHSMQLQVTKRTSHGVSATGSYTWSKNLGLGESEGDVDPRDPRNRNLDKGLLSFHRTHVIASNGVWSLPFGQNRAMLGNAPGWLQRIVGQWNLGGLMRWSSGQPLAFRAGGLSNIWQSAANTTPVLLGDLPTPQLTMRSGALPTYFPGLTVGNDPSRSTLPTTDTLNLAGDIRAIFDAQGRPLLVNPQAGQVGTLAKRILEGPSRLQLDMNLQKRIRIDEKRELEFRADVTNVLNHPVFAAPTTNINSANFGLIDSASDGRKVVFGARLNF